MLRGLVKSTEIDRGRLMLRDVVKSTENLQKQTSGDIGGVVKKYRNLLQIEVDSKKY